MNKELNREMNNELKPCPFCGMTAEIKEETECFGHGDYDESVYVRCRVCLTTSAKYYKRDWHGKAKERAIEAWNTRKHMDDIAEQLKELKRPYSVAVTYSRTSLLVVEEINKAIEIVKGGNE